VHPPYPREVVLLLRDRGRPLLRQGQRLPQPRLRPEVLLQKAQELLEELYCSDLKVQELYCSNLKAVYFCHFVIFAIFTDGNYLHVSHKIEKFGHKMQ
jgi:hypothetical protein